MIVALFGVVELQGIFGLFTLEHNDAVAGPLKRIASEETVKRMSFFHRRGFNVILAFVGLHVIANLVYQLFKRDPLITGMITGKKPAAHYEDEAEAEIVARPAWRAFVCLIVAAAIVFGGILALGGKF